ncbi:MAG: PEP-CTERM sorting domain-containing protein [Phycisphaerales bacterium]|nr:PEP-CTERM sorting domain-containing protein [Phycisphaerales bacterium]
MNKIATITGLAVAATAMSASADMSGASNSLLNIDLRVVNQITITAKDGVSLASVTGSDSLGVYMADFYNSDPGSILETLVGGDLVSAGTISDGTPNLYSFTGNFGLNFWSWTDDSPSVFTAGSLAFTGSATWTLTAEDYANLLSGNTTGSIYAFADSDDDIAGASLIGTWKVIPAPSSLALLGLGGIVAGRRRR